MQHTSAPVICARFQNSAKGRKLPSIKATEHIAGRTGEYKRNVRRRLESINWKNEETSVQHPDRAVRRGDCHQSDCGVNRSDRLALSLDSDLADRGR
jgi:hypothetical protein